MFINFGELDNFLPRLVATWFPLIKVILLNLSPRGHSPQQAGSSGRKVYVIEFWPMILVTIIAQIYNTVSVHCREEGCIGKYIPRGPRDFPRAGILHPEAREIARGRSPRAISRADPNHQHLVALSHMLICSSLFSQCISGIEYVDLSYFRVIDLRPEI